MNKQRLFLFIPLLVFVVLAIFFWRGLSLDPNAMPSALLNKPVPVFELPVLPAPENPSGLVTANQELLKGRVSLLNVWATWCVTCRQEHEFLNTLKAQGIPIYGINYKDNNDDAQNWLAELHNPYVFSVIDADGRLGLNLGVFGAPETYIIDKQGVIRYKHIGDVNAAVWENTIKPIFNSLQ
ncbi:cytochrome C biogenesis protein CcmG [Cellvibrio sp. BR]|jgi:cytochrome c biogenesis protein CcmG/thiol:disulfide interchange protein DsbE|uniref:DsbE family thiol:disulfide interchange protein n=1 Tax=unclassified Cellvibrio TaxID=2624793 RepID=UPI0002600F14|nr:MULTISPECIES: DsbE family thiol:disulfide interchange protein [unclassified Cellvibrio]EIK45125.1 cytochrome C biogenesis protein CcmG [Cellvibrio sp. BR]QEY13192.1 DsbE family thiol:disulfide interchange protein [Cellvibrio sp. KY-YJ-3]